MHSCRAQDLEQWRVGADGVHGRMRGGLDDVSGEAFVEDTNDAVAFFNQWGLPNLLDDGIDEEAPEDDALSSSHWTRDRLEVPLFPGSRYTVEQYSYALMKIKNGSIHDDRADQLCKLLAEVLPDGYRGPRCVRRECRGGSRFPLHLGVSLVNDRLDQCLGAGVCMS